MNKPEATKRTIVEIKSGRLLMVHSASKHVLEVVQRCDFWERTPQKFGSQVVGGTVSPLYNLETAIAWLSELSDENLPDDINGDDDYPRILVQLAPVGDESDGD